jgi:hypothetical protein
MIFEPNIGPPKENPRPDEVILEEGRATMLRLATDPELRNPAEPAVSDAVPPRVMATGPCEFGEMRKLTLEDVADADWKDTSTVPAVQRLASRIRLLPALESVTSDAIDTIALTAKCADTTMLPLSASLVPVWVIETVSNTVTLHTAAVRSSAMLCLKLNSGDVNVADPSTMTSNDVG